MFGKLDFILERYDRIERTLSSTEVLAQQDVFRELAEKRTCQVGTDCDSEMFGI